MFLNRILEKLVMKFWTSYMQLRMGPFVNFSEHGCRHASDISTAWYAINCTMRLVNAVVHKVLKKCEATSKFWAPEGWQARSKFGADKY
jgi:hypothetical protein